MPSSSIDWTLRDGLREIPIEERSARELSHMTGRTESGEKLLKASSIDALTANQIGALEAGRMLTTRPERSRDVDFHPGDSDRFSLAFLIHRKTGILSWAGIRNTFFWIDPRHGIAGVLMLQLLPFCDRSALSLLGAFQRQHWWAVLAATGVILSACYMLWMFQRVVFGEVTHEENRSLKDLDLRERLVFVPLLVLIFWMGVAPQPFLDRMQPTLDRTLAIAEQRSHAPAAVLSSPAPAPAATTAPTGGAQ